MAKKVATILKLQIPAGAANPSPPVGPALGQAAVNVFLSAVKETFGKLFVKVDFQNFWEFYGENKQSI